MMDDRTDKPSSNGTVICKTWSWDWDIWLDKIFKKRKPEDVASDQALQLENVDVSTSDHQNIHEPGGDNSCLNRVERSAISSQWRDE